MYLNRERTMQRRSHEIVCALGTMTGGGLTPEYFAALHDDDETAAREFAKYEAHRALDQL